jgi:ferritin-like metal-binding protein YciE
MEDPTSKLQDKLGDYLEDALALEEGVVTDLDSMVGTIGDPKLKEQLQRHRQISRQHVERLKQRLEQLDRGTPVRKKIEGMAVALMKGVSDVLRTDAPGKVARDAYLLAHTQIASYELLGRLADAAGDTVTSELARTHLADEKKCADEIAAHWDDFFKLTLVQWTEERSPVPVT